MGYNPQQSDLDFEDIELGRFGDRLKKGFKAVGKGLDKVTEATITKPSMMIGKAIGGKKGEAIGKKLGGFTSKVTKLSTGAALAAPLIPLAASPTVLTTAGTVAAHGIAAKKLLAKKKKAKVKTHAKAKAKAPAKAKSGARKSSSGACVGDNALAGRVAAMLVEKLGGPLGNVDAALKLAQLQRQATYEHNKLMGDADFRKKVLAALTAMAAMGDQSCTRTVRVLMGRQAA